MNEQNKQYLKYNYSLKEQAEQGTLVLDEVQKREFYKILQEEVDRNLIVNLYSQQNVNEMVDEVFEKYDEQNEPEDQPTLKTVERKTTVTREEVSKAVKKSVKKK